jgi:two-component system, chemotaxis family, sensor kinase CheA
MSDELMGAFIEDSKEHLESIESDIMALENLDGDYDEELINRIFRTAHSIKGAAGFFGLETIGSLAHKLENALHLMRDQQLRPERGVCQILLEGFDQLSMMINAPETSEQQDISEILNRIQNLLTPESQASTETNMALPATGGQHIFDVDQFTLDQGLKGGKFLYHLEFDLIHDIHRKNKTPYEIIKTLQDSGLILDCRVDIEATGTLDMGFAHNIPLNVLFASIIDPDVIGVLIDVPAEKIRELEKSMFQVQSDASSQHGDQEQPAVPEPDQGFHIQGSLAVVPLAEHLRHEHADEFRKIVLNALGQSTHIRLDMSQARQIDACFAQTVGATLKTCADRNGSFAISPPPPKTIRDQLRAMGFAWLLWSDA